MSGQHMRLSEFGQKFTARTGILQLMDDLGHAMSGSEKKYMLGGGNPAQVPEVNAVWRRRMQEIMEREGDLERMLANYDPPQGNGEFIAALARLLRSEYGWDISERNIAITNGSQTSFYLLFNMLAGPDGTGMHRRILFPLTPEYIGYADQSIRSEDFRSVPAGIERIDEHTFKYHVDFDHLTVDDDVAAICVSRPTNPTGNVITDSEMDGLDRIARDAGIPLIVDNAYGVPFPGMIFEEATPMWNENIILTMSLSKMGLPGTRTGIVIAGEQMIEAISSCNAILSLSNGSVGQKLVTPLVESGEILDLSRSVVRPFYKDKSRRALDYIHSSFDESVDYAVHKSEGSLFLWIWFRNLPITTVELYERLKARHTIVVPGTYFFFGFDQPWAHRDECIRINFGMADDDVRTGIRMIGEEAARAVAEA